MGGENVAKKLVGGIAAAGLGKSPCIEYFREISIGAERLLLSTLKVSLSKFRLNQQISQSQINLGAVEPAIQKRNAGFATKARCLVYLSPEQPCKPAFTQ